VEQVSAFGERFFSFPPKRQFSPDSELRLRTPNPTPKFVLLFELQLFDANLTESKLCFEFAVRLIFIYLFNQITHYEDALLGCAEGVWGQEGGSKEFISSHYSFSKNFCRSRRPGRNCIPAHPDDLSIKKKKKKKKKWSIRVTCNHQLTKDQKIRAYFAASFYFPIISWTEPYSYWK